MTEKMEENKTFPFLQREIVVIQFWRLIFRKMSRECITEKEIVTNCNFYLSISSSKKRLRKLYYNSIKKKRFDFSKRLN